MAFEPINVTPGSGASALPVAMDKVGDDYIQVVKLNVGADGVSAPLSTTNPMPSQLVVTENDYVPGYSEDSGSQSELTVDPSGQLKVRGAVLTDEGGYRANFANASLAIALGSCTFTTGSNVVSGTSFSTKDIHLGDYVYLDADGVSYAVQVDSLTDTNLYLVSNYTGTGGTGASSRQILLSKTGTGGSIAVSSGNAVITSGTDNNQVFELERDADYLPIVKQCTVTISQRIANQDIYVGFYDEDGKWYYWFHYTGTTNTSVNCVCAWNPTTVPSGGEISTQTITLPNGLTSASANRHRIELLKDRVNFYINDILVAVEYNIVPHPHDIQTSTLRVVNGTGAGSSTTVTVGFDACFNYNAVACENPSQTMQVIAGTPPLARFTGSVSANNADFFVMDCQFVNIVHLRVSSVGGGGTVSWQVSDDPTFSVTISQPAQPAAGGANVTSSTSVGHWTIIPTARYLRVRTTAYTSGTLTAEANTYGGNKGQIIRGHVDATLTSLSGIAGAAAHDAAISGNPLRIAGRALTSNYTTVATGDTADLITTLVGALIQKPYAIPELEYVCNDSITASATAVQVKAATASNKNYVSGLSIQSATLGSAGYVMLRSTPVASTTATISGNTLVMSASYNWKVGDLVLVTASTVTGLSAGSYYYILTVSSANLTFSSTRGGGTLSISGTSVSATLSKVMWRTTLQTAALPLTDITFTNPIDGGTGLAIEMVTPTSLTSGVVDFNVRGYVAP